MGGEKQSKSCNSGSGKKSKHSAEHKINRDGNPKPTPAVPKFWRAVPGLCDELDTRHTATIDVSSDGSVLSLIRQREDKIKELEKLQGMYEASDSAARKRWLEFSIISKQLKIKLLKKKLRCHTVQSQTSFPENRRRNLGSTSYQYFDK